jgi:hypothetical protein
MARVIQVIRKRLPGEKEVSLHSAHPTLDAAKAELERMVDETGPGGFSHGLRLHIRDAGYSAWLTLSDAHPVLEIEEVTLFDEEWSPSRFQELLRNEGFAVNEINAQFMGLAIFTRGWRPQFAISQLKLWVDGVRNGDIHDETIKMMDHLGVKAFA